MAWRHDSTWTGAWKRVMWVALDLPNRSLNSSERLGNLNPVAAAIVGQAGLVGAQLFAAVSFGLAASRGPRRLRLTWWLLAGSAFVAAAGQGLLLATSHLPLVMDALTMLAVVLGAVGFLALPSAPSRASTRVRVLVNASIVAISLFFIAWMAGLADVYRLSGGSALGLWMMVGYLAGDVIIVVVLRHAILHARGALRGALLVIAAGVAMLALTTLVISFLVATARFVPADRILEVGFVAAFLTMGLAPLWPRVDVTKVVPEGPAGTVTVVTPPAAIAVVVLAILGLKLAGRALDSSYVPIVLGALLMVLLTISQVVANRDLLGLLADSSRTRDQLWDRTLLLDSVITHVPAGLAQVGPGLTIVDANPRVHALLSGEGRDFIGAPLSRFLPDADVQAAVTRFRPFRSSTTDTYQSMSQATRVDGSRVWVAWSMTAVRNPRREIDYFLVMFEDVDARRQAEQTAIANLEGLERLNRLKSEFVSMVSHEFRTALVGIQGFSELMREGDLDPADVHRFAADIFHDAQRLNRLITVMLDLDRIDPGPRSFRYDPVDLNRLVVTAVERAQASSGKHRLCVNLDPTLPLVIGDESRLMQLMANLLSNAIKYSPAGGMVAVGTIAQEAGATITVRDYGSGMSPEQIDRLFDGYETATPRIVGAGLGLAIARRIIDAHSGRLSVQSQLGRGTEFRVRLPRTMDSAGG